MSYCLYILYQNKCLTSIYVHLNHCDCVIISAACTTSSWKIRWQVRTSMLENMITMARSASYRCYTISLGRRRSKRQRRGLSGLWWVTCFVLYSIASGPAVSRPTRRIWQATTVSNCISVFENLRFYETAIAANGRVSALPVCTYMYILARSTMLAGCFFRSLVCLRTYVWFEEIRAFNYCVGLIWIHACVQISRLE